MEHIQFPIKEATTLNHHMAHQLISKLTTKITTINRKALHTIFILTTCLKPTEQRKLHRILQTSRQLARLAITQMANLSHTILTNDRTACYTVGYRQQLSEPVG